ncbi:MAG: hypothetical protein SNI51_00435 [Rikenellaceae bacterium]
MKHLIRSIKYFILMMVVLVVVTLLMRLNGSIEITPSEQLAIFMANNGALKLAFFVVLAATYPLFGFVKRGVEGDIVENRDQIIVAMESSGFTLCEERDGVMIFRANTILRRIAFLFEDRIEVRQVANQIQMDGIRKGVVYAVYCLDGFIKNSKRGE